MIYSFYFLKHYASCFTKTFHFVSANFAYKIPYSFLQEKTIEPSDYNLFPNYDWIIGNHSDELTPWIPVIAARYILKYTYEFYKLSFFINFKIIMDVNIGITLF